MYLENEEEMRRLSSSGLARERERTRNRGK